MDFLKFLFIGTVVWLTIHIFLDDPIFYAPIPIQHIPGFIYELMLVMFALLVLMLLLVAIINFIIKKKEHSDEMKMTKQEVKEERKVRKFLRRLNLPKEEKQWKWRWGKIYRMFRRLMWL